MTVDGVRAFCRKCHGVFHECEMWGKNDDLCYTCFKKEDKK